MTNGASSGFRHHPHFWLCLLLTAGEFALLYAMFTGALPEKNKDIAQVLIGGYSAEWARSIAYWYNTTFGSNNKTEALMKAEPIKDRP
jgi:hypothetical protein